MGYTHLTAGERYQIQALLGKNHSLSCIAAALARNKSTISREVQRNRGQRGYRPKQAQELAEGRRAEALNARQIDPETWEVAKSMLRLEHSPEQVSGRLLLETGSPQISHETIYRRVYADKAAGGTLHGHLRCQKKRRKRYASGRTRRGRIPNRVDIDHRPAHVEARKTVGHWEGDTVIGRSQKGALVTHVERKTRYTCIRKVARRTAQNVAQSTIAALRPLSVLVQTITNDNGLEFAAHAEVADVLGSRTYFAHPYCSWQRGTNENTNGLIRQYLPKKTSFEALTDEQVAFIEQRLNHRPRKCLAYRTPHEVLLKSAKTKGVALRI